MQREFAILRILAMLVPLFAIGPTARAATTPEHVVSIRQSVLSRERYLQLRDEWKAYTDSHPRDALGWAQLARVSSYVGTPCEEYVGYAERAVQLDPESAEACAILGRYRWQTYCSSQPQRPDEAMRLLEHALKLDPRLDDPHYILWTMLMSQDKPAEANAHLRTLLDHGRMPEPLVDFGYNLLAGLEPNAILLTNGDNDTYPLIGLQNARNVRPDVAVVNLSMLNLEWYRRQLRDGVNEVPVPLLKQSKGNTQPWAQSDEAVKGLIKSMARDGWRRPLYASVTVANVQERVSNELSLEGLVYRVQPGSGTASGVDVLRMERNFDDVYRLQSAKSLSVDWDERSAVRMLLNNYGAAMLRLAPALADGGRLDEGRKRIEWMLDMAHFHKQDPARLTEWIEFWSQRDPKCPDLARWREKYTR
jgi:tetratricopeptide (TPR) repeat protein